MYIMALYALFRILYAEKFKAKINIYFLFFEMLILFKVYLS